MIEAESHQDYAEILMLPRPVSKYPPMERAYRAKQFAPFAALKGFGEAIAQTEMRSIEEIERKD